jgi:hypothetical protein
MDEKPEAAGCDVQQLERELAALQFQASMANVAWARNTLNGAVRNKRAEIYRKKAEARGPGRDQWGR